MTSQGKNVMRKKVLTISRVLGLIMILGFFMSLATALPVQSSAAGAISANTVVNQSTGTISFSGYVWYAENSGSGTIYPGPNHWSSSANNIWVDSSGWLHLQLTYSRGIWYAASLTTVQTLGYGTYSFVISNNAATMDKNVVLGLFAYKDDSHEVDIEFSTWGVTHGNNAWFTVQPSPYTMGYNAESFNAKLTGSYSTHFFSWGQSNIFFESLQGQSSITNPPTSSIITSFTSPLSPSPTGVSANINLWLLNGHAPSNGKTVAVVIKSFSFTPAT